MLDAIRESWKWKGLEPGAIVATNPFGNYVVRAADGVFWRICPEELSCEIIAADGVAFKALWASEEFQSDLRMTRLVDLAREKLGPVDDERCYCLKVPAPLGGEYDESNLGTISRRELIEFSGKIAYQLKDASDGDQVIIDIVE